MAGYTGPWNFKESDYTLAQYQRACLIDNTPAGKETAKSDLALPVRTPDGRLAKNGLVAAEGRLGQCHTTPEKKAKAARAIIAGLKQFDMVASEACYKTAGMTRPKVS